MRGSADADYVDLDALPSRMAKAADAKKKYVADVAIEDIPKTVAELRKQMHAAAEDLDFEKAAELRDRIKALEAIELAVAAPERTFRGTSTAYTDEEAQRLIDQAEFLAPWVFDGLSLDGVGTLLEVGMGVGAETRLLRARWPQLHVLGCDISEAQLGHARRVLAGDIAAGAVELAHASATAAAVAGRDGGRGASSAGCSSTCPIRRR